MLKTRHDHRGINTRLMWRSSKASVYDALADLRGFGPSTEGVTQSALQKRVFAERYMALRDDLAWRAARGQILSPAERATLQALEAILDDLAEPSAGLPEEIEHLVLDALRRK